MFKATFLHKNADIDHYVNHHVKLALPFPGVRKLTMGRVVQNPMTPNEPPEWNLLNEIYFDDVDAYVNAYTSDAAKIAFEDLGWTDLTTTIWVVSTEEDIPLT